MTVHAPLPARRALLIGCALAGLVAVPWRAQLAAQAFDANPKTVAGLVAYDRATAKVETITVESPTAIINWSPGAGTFLPFGNTATFTNGPNNTDYVVLNRILSNTPVRFDGRVVGLLQDIAVGTSAPGGTVIFSSPGGIILGPTAVFDVGSLVLTSLGVVDDGAGNFYDPATQGLQFAQPAGAPITSVITLPGAQINAPSESSYVAIVSPQVLHGGAIRVNGSAAFIAGQQVQMRVNQGLFDIIVDAGTPVTAPLVHAGSTGGPASTGAADVHRLYLVAMPVNQAITAVLQGNAGFDPAINAAVENGAIILSAGFSVVGGQVDRYGQLGAPGPVPGVDANFEIRGGSYSSDLTGFAVTDMLAGTAPGSNLAFTQDVSLFAGQRAHLFSGGNNQSVQVGGDALVSTVRNNAPDGAIIDHQGGESLIFANAGGSVAIAGNATVDASGQGEVNVVQSRAGTGTGGSAGVFADRGTVQIKGSLRVLATGQGGQLDLFPDQGGAGAGGTAFVEGRNGGDIGVGGNLLIDTSGTASRSNGVVPNPAAIGSGGKSTLAAIGGGNVAVNGAATLNANGTGGDVRDDAVVPAGNGQGGQVTVSAAGNVTLTGDAVLSANAAGGTGPTGGNGRGGTVTLAAASFVGPGGAQGGTLTAGNVAGTASATGAPGTANTPGAWFVRAVEGSTVNAANLILTAAANGTPALRPFSSLEALNGTINVTQLAALITPGEIRVTAAGAGRMIGGSYTLNAGEDVTIAHTGLAAGAATIDVTSLAAIAGDDFSLGAGAVTRTADSTEVRAADLATVAGRMLGRSIVIGSSDIDLPAAGGIGDAQTQSVTLLVGAIVKPLPGQFTVLGGTTQGPRYTLTDAEAGRIRAGRLSIQVPVTGGTGPDLLVRDLILNGSGAANGVGALEILTAGTARVEGAISITNATATTAFTFLATNRLEVVTPAGSVRVRDGAGAPGGTLTLQSNNLWIAPTAVIDRLRADPNYAGRDADLLFNTGVVEPRGYVEANGVALRTGGTLFVQNSGLPFTSGFAGVTVGGGGLVVRGPDNAVLASVTAFGRRLNADGSFVVATPFFLQVDFQTPGVPLATDYTAGSTLNTCIIVTGQCGGVPALQPSGPDPIIGPTGGSSAIQLPGMSDEDDLVDTSFSSDPLIEEPVTSGGESSLWECDRDGDGDCDDEDD